VIAIVHLSANVTGMGFGFARRRVDVEAMSVTSTSRTIKYTVNVCMRAGFHESPSILFGLADRLAYVFVGMLRHESSAALSLSL
jgi:hypothetical protein